VVSREGAAVAGEARGARAEEAASPQRLQLSGERARQYLGQKGEGRSLMRALTAARFGLRWQEHAAVGEKGGAGYLGMSHVQNLNAWFDEEGATIRRAVRLQRCDQR
jgi:hypothetical protein